MRQTRTFDGKISFIVGPSLMTRQTEMIRLYAICILSLICLPCWAVDKAVPSREVSASHVGPSCFGPLVPDTHFTDNQAVFNSDEYGGQAYERGVMAYGTREEGGGWWSVQKQITTIVEAELKKKQAAGSSNVEVLDVGSGPGFTVNEINKLAPQCCRGMNVHARGLEYNPKMVILFAGCIWHRSEAR